jgi:hypothetical protein
MSKSIDVYKFMGGKRSQAGLKEGCDRLGKTTKKQPFLWI